VDAPLQPLGAYGRSKAVGEIAIRGSGAEFLIVRTSWLYAPWGNNFVRTMARLTRDKPELKVVRRSARPSHQRATPGRCHPGSTRPRTRGTFHVTDGGECTWYEFTVEIARLLGRGAIIAPAPPADSPARLDGQPTACWISHRPRPSSAPCPDWRTEPGRVWSRNWNCRRPDV